MCLHFYFATLTLRQQTSYCVTVAPEYTPREYTMEQDSPKSISREKGRYQLGALAIF